MYDPKDTRGVPISSGIPPIVTWTGLVGLILIFIIAGMVLATSGYGHVWPAENSLRIKLG
jgi:hypothetical protein